jgi:HSP20 family molecular chaperone IbpA
MREQSAAGRLETATPVRLVSTDVLVKKKNEIDGMIAVRAYELFECRSRVDGHDTDDWIAAELELLHPCRHDLRESAEALIFRADLPGSFRADQLEVSVEPRRLRLSGERQVSMMCGDAKGTHTELRSQRIFQVEELPTDVDPSRVTAKMDGEILEIMMEKVSAAKATNERAKAASSQR